MNHKNLLTKLNDQLNETTQLTSQITKNQENTDNRESNADLLNAIGLEIQRQGGN